MDPKWLEWAKKLQAISQNGLTFAHNDFDADRYKCVREIAADMMAQAAGQPVQVVVDLFASQQGYATPKVDVRGAAFEPGSGRILMVRERSDGAWTLPGGWADPNESPAGNVVREVFEESGFETRAVKLLCVYDRSRHGHTPAYPFHVYKMFFRCELIGGSARPDSEIVEIDFFEEGKLPPLSRARITEQQMARIFEHFRNPDWPTDFD